MEYIPLLVLIISFVGLLAIGTPVAWSIAISSMLTLLVSMPMLPAFTTISQRMATGLDSFALLAIPFFILSGELMNHGGIAHRLIAFAKTLVGALPPRQVMAPPFACEVRPSTTQWRAYAPACMTVARTCSTC